MDRLQRHLNVAYYTLIFDHGTDVFYPLCGFGERYKNATGPSTFAAECHIGYQREGSIGDEGRATIRRVVPFTEDPMENLSQMWEAHKDLPVPDQVGSVMKIKSPIT